MASNNTNHIVFAVTNGVSVLVCLLAAILVCCLKLCTKVVYRLALYQVLASLALATVSVFQIIFVNYNKNPEVYERVCIAIGWLALYAEWMKLLFTTWVTFHLFCFGVFHKNLKKLEVLYVLTSLLVPVVIAAVPLITSTYGLTSDGTLCYISVENNSAAIERFALWDGPSMVFLLVASTAMVVMLIKLALNLHRRSMYEPIGEGDQFWKALKQLLPLAAFPVLFLVFEIPVFIFHINLTNSSIPYKAATMLDYVFFSLWSTTSGVTIIIHITAARLCVKRKVTLDNKYIRSSQRPTFRQETGSHMYSNTRFSVSTHSIISN